MAFVVGVSRRCDFLEWMVEDGGGEEGGRRCVREEDILS